MGRLLKLIFHPKLQPMLFILLLNKFRLEQKEDQVFP